MYVTFPMDDELGSMISTAASENCMSSKPPASSPSLFRFKGVVQQQNGHWGAQIYANHQRIWLGTFKYETSAARAYDRAAMKLRFNDDLHLNTPWTDRTNYELGFQDLYATDAVLAMIRDGSYEPKFNEFMKSIGKGRVDGGDANAVPAGDCVDCEGMTLHELFQKELTPSDVGKLNRLVIPKKHAVKYFPYLQTVDKEGEYGGKEPESGAGEGLILQFKDRLDRLWEFRYCYWKSSQSFVFTKGWNKFVKTNNLRAKDTVTFYMCEDREGVKRPFCMIDVGHYSGGGEAIEGGFSVHIGGGVGLGLGDDRRYEAAAVGIARKEGEKGEGETVEDPVAGHGVKKAVWLFGVRIS